MGDHLTNKVRLWERFFANHNLNRLLDKPGSPVRELRYANSFFMFLSILGLLAEKNSYWRESIWKDADGTLFSPYYGRIWVFCGYFGRTYPKAVQAVFFQPFSYSESRLHNKNPLFHLCWIQLRHSDVTGYSSFNNIHECPATGANHPFSRFDFCNPALGI